MADQYGIRDARPRRINALLARDARPRRINALLAQDARPRPSQTSGLLFGDNHSRRQRGAP
jgi:hypothetical protein